MIESVSQTIEVYSIQEKSDIIPAADAVMGGKITLLKVGSVFSFIYNPGIAGLTEKVSILKERRLGQLMSMVCTYGQAKKIVDMKRVNQDLFHLTPEFCGKAIIRIPVEASFAPPFPHDTDAGTAQFLSFEGTHPLRDAFREELATRGCEYIPITSGNISGAPTIEDFESAKKLAAHIKTRASFMGMDGIQTAVIDIPDDKGPHKGSFIILSFCNPEAIEVKRLADKTDRDATEKYLDELLPSVQMRTPLVYAL